MANFSLHQNFSAKLSFFYFWNAPGALAEAYFPKATAKVVNLRITTKRFAKFISKKFRPAFHPYRHISYFQSIINPIISTNSGDL